MTILLTADCVGGVWTYTLDLIRSLPQHRFIVATMGDLPSQAQRDAIAKLSNATLVTSQWKLEWMDEPWDDVERAGQWLLELEREFSPDLIHLNGYCHAALAFRAPKLVVAHSCVLSWWRAVKGEDAPPEWGCYRQNIATGLQRADLVVSPTAALLDELRVIYGEFAPSHVVWNGSPIPPGSATSSERFVLCAGRLWDEAKNVGLLSRVAPLLDAPIRAAGQSGANDLANNGLELLGFLAEAQMSEQMQKAAIWAHPARYEPFGLAVLEAAGRGCALVLSDIGTLRELWEEAAIFVAPDDEEGWVSALQHLLDNPTERDEWACKAKTRAARYNIERFAAEYERIYQEMTA